MNQLARLLDQGVRDGPGRVAQREDGHAAAEVEITPARDVPDLAAGAVAQDEVEAAVGRHDVLLEQRLDLRGFIADNGRRRWNDFFHVLRITRKGNL